MNMTNKYNFIDFIPPPNPNMPIMQKCQCNEKQWGYPPDDENSILAGCCGNFRCNCGADLSVYYPHQFIQNEHASLYQQKMCDWVYAVEYTPVIPDTVVGTVYHEDTAVCTFHSMNKGIDFQINPIGKNHPASVLQVGIDHTTGLLTVTWDRVVKRSASKVVVSYEYSIECQTRKCPKCGHFYFDDAQSLQDLANGDGTLDLY